MLKLFIATCMVLLIFGGLIGFSSAVFLCLQHFGFVAGSLVAQTIMLVSVTVYLTFAAMIVGRFDIFSFMGD